MTKTATKKPRAGRPTAAQAKQRHLELLDISVKLFLENGFDATTLDDIAAAVHMTKRTIYGHYENKEALFRASLQKAFHDHATPIEETLGAVVDDDLETTLVAIALQRANHFLTPRGLALQRIVNTESHRFPELLGLLYQESTAPTANFVQQVLQQHAERGEIFLERPETTASLFLSMAVGAPARGMLTGIKVEGFKNLEDHIHFCVKLFLNGLRVSD